MKLLIVPARTGVQWFKSGVRTFFRQPLALSGLFLLFMGLMSLLSVLPYIGNILALGLLPAATLGLMAATREASNGKFPMPTVLLSAFRASRHHAKAMLLLGLLYAFGFLLVLAISATIDGGTFAHLYMFGGDITPEKVADPHFVLAVLFATVLYMPLSLLFWHAPALVHWHGVPPVKSLFFSMVACWRNIGAFTIYNIVWLGAFLVMGIVVTLVIALLGEPEAINGILFPLALVMAAMYFTSIDYTFRDCFSDDNTPV